MPKEGKWKRFCGVDGDATGWSGVSATVDVSGGYLRIAPSASGSSTSKTFTGLNVGKRYILRVRADRGSGPDLRIAITGVAGTTTLLNTQQNTILFTATSASTTVTISQVSSSTVTYWVDQLELGEDHIYEATLMMSSDYYPFGMQMPGRSTNFGNYRYGYTGKESDPETKGTGNSYDFGERQYDPRLGRWLSLDPLKAIYPSMTPYCYAGNAPIAAKDPDGNLIIFVNGFTGGSVASENQKSIPGKEYWTSEFRDAAQEYFGGDSKHIFLDGSHSEFGLSMAWERQAIGKAVALESAAAIKEYLEKAGDEETIKIITHSMGAAYAEGFIEGLIEAGIDPKRIEKVVHLSAADASDITICDKGKDIKRVQLGVDQDYTLYAISPEDCSLSEKLAKADPFADGDERMIPGVDVYGEVNVDGDQMLKYGYIKDPVKRKEAQDKYNYHAYTKWNKGTFDALKELEKGTLVSQRVSSTSGKTIYTIKFPCGEFGWNFLKRGKDKSFVKNTESSGKGDEYYCE
ncbi:RHS repeat-associated core domain-containing protein [Fluviicola sp.]|uniref:RHS repeat-associated core domain-containing protein n=1 Tax=Fluviicola sp. TaxID=1917219 RepID=UPI00260D9C9B|nr:RHS repeat-associated core domain-containing protein [Fluviicola sp.]